MVLLFSSVINAETVKIGDLWYNVITKAMTAEVIAPTDETIYSGDIIIPETVTFDDIICNVSSIGNNAFYENRQITSISFPNNLTSIGDYSFYQCDALHSISLTKNIQSIGKYSFYSCDNLVNVDLCNVVSIGDFSFCGCESISSIVIPNTVVSIGRFAFGNTNIASVKMGSGVETIGGDAFCNCKFSAIDLPKSLKSIGSQAFRNCKNLENIILPEGLTQIWSGAFMGCSFTSINIPSTVTSIGEFAFAGCSNLKAVYIDDLAAWCRINYSTFDDRTGNPLFTAKHLYLNNVEIKNLVIPDGITSILYNSFPNGAFETITIPSSVTTINSSAFRGCNNVKSLSIPNNVKYIYDKAFADCTALETITIGNSVKMIEAYAFANCEKLIKVSCLAETIPRTETTVFDNSYPEYITLYVPTVSVGNYKATAPWSSFGKVKSLDDTIVEFIIEIDIHGNVSHGDKAFANNSNTIYVKNSETQEITITPDEGYEIEQVILNDVDITSQVTEDGKLSLTITKDSKLKISFSLKATSSTITMANELATYCCAYDLDFTNVSGLKAYLAGGYDKANGKVMLMRVNSVPAGTGLILMGEAGTYKVPYSTSTAFYTNLLKGVTASTTINPTDGSNTNFILANGTNGIGFYAVSSSGELAAGKAYLQLPTSAAQAKSVKMVFEDETTGIVENYEFENKNNDGTVYDLMGRKVKNMTKGMYIMNGKKVIIK